jgi:hypothetical protein
VRPLRPKSMPYNEELSGTEIKINRRSIYKILTVIVVAMLVILRNSGAATPSIVHAVQCTYNEELSGTIITMNQRSLYKMKRPNLLPHLLFSAQRCGHG